MSGDKVTLKDIYAIVNRLEDKMDHNLDEMKTNISTTNKQLADIQSQVSNIKGWAAGIALTVSVAISLLSVILKGLFKQ
jgi:archaellum component FlaC